MLPGAENLKVTSILFRSCMCVGVRMRAFNDHHPSGKENMTRVQTQQMWWTEEATSHLKSFYAMNRIWGKKKKKKKTGGGEGIRIHKWEKSLIYHTWFIVRFLI